MVFDMISKNKRLALSSVIAATLVLLGLLFGLHVLRLDKMIKEKFTGKIWALPAEVYARPLELYAGLALSPQILEDELELAGYRKENETTTTGAYARHGDAFDIVTRDFQYPSGLEKSDRITVSFAGEIVRDIVKTGTADTLSLVRIDPARIGSFHALEHEGRILLSHSELPDLLVKTLLAVEDQHFYTHHGIAPLSILRALFANIRAGETVQGGSTLTQQLAKNFFLTNERSLKRKINEAIMALLIELHYEKDEILTAYANEIFLGQDGNRAVHGFGLASHFYFRRDLADLTVDQVALLVGMIKGPTSYDPRKNPAESLKRRAVVLAVLRDEGIINEPLYQTAMNEPLDKATQIMKGANRFPAFLDLVRRQLSKEYREEDLNGNGLKILTTLDPQVQWQMERHLDQTLNTIEQQAGRQQLEGAMVITNRENGEILALAGGRKPLAAGFNRAINAKRPIGSLIKPAVYLTALGQGYTLASPLQDTAVTLKEQGAKTWRPQNYDKKEHGQVPFYLALANSYNLATVNLGLEVGVDKVIDTAKNLGLTGTFEPYPSFLLGTAEASPLEVSQMYQTLASGGFFQPQRCIESVMGSDHSLLKRYGLSVEQRFPAERIFLLNTALQHTVSEGTAQLLSRYIPASHTIAGKTGTTDNLRDSWFAGFTGDRLAVVWIGRDDNKPAGVTGATGALVVWGEIMRSLQPQPLKLSEPAGIEWAWINKQSLASTSLNSQGSISLPFIAGTAPESGQFLPSIDQHLQEIEQKAKGLLNSIRGLFD